MVRIAGLLLAIVIAGTAHAEERFITLSSTTSTQDSGLSDHILPIFRAASGLSVHVVAGRNGAKRSRLDSTAMPMRSWFTIAQERTSSLPTASALIGVT